eukprot:Hpha_TRINITY_DN15805_c0_g6::TRINITY_DN15805_c0_g6_i1::g.190181::m.190181
MGHGIALPSHGCVAMSRRVAAATAAVVATAACAAFSTAATLPPHLASATPEPVPPEPAIPEPIPDRASTESVPVPSPRPTKGGLAAPESPSLKRLLSCADQSNDSCAWAVKNPAVVRRLVQTATGTGTQEALLVPLHRALDRIMVVACEGKKRGCIDGFLLPEQATAYFEWAEKSWEGGTLCETGFNAGHSAVAFLLGRGASRVVSFDLMTQAYSRATLDWLRAVFGPERLDVIAGDTSKTLPRVAASGELRCDAISVDAAHNARACRRDLRGLTRMTSSTRVPVLMDDTAPGFERGKGPGDVWRTLVKEGRLREERCVEYGLRTQWRRGSRAKPRGWCLGEVRRGLEPIE